MADSYGQWHRPAFGELHTAPRPGRTRAPYEWTAREGAGDYRRLDAGRPASQGRGKQRPGAQYHNPGPVALPGTHRQEHAPRVYVARRNGLPVGRSYGPAAVVEDGGRAWRQPGNGWAARVAARNLDVAAIRAADAELKKKGQRA